MKYFDFQDIMLSRECFVLLLTGTSGKLLPAEQSTDYKSALSWDFKILIYPQRLLMFHYFQSEVLEVFY